MVVVVVSDRSLDVPNKLILFSFHFSYSRVESGDLPIFIWKSARAISFAFISTYLCPFWEDRSVYRNSILYTYSVLLFLSHGVISWPFCRSILTRTYYSILHAQSPVENIQTRYKYRTIDGLDWWLLCRKHRIHTHTHIYIFFTFFLIFLLIFVMVSEKICLF